MARSWPKVFRDPVHNLMAFDNTPCDRLLLALIDTREMQRLRRIKQMGMTELVFPGANHSRFAHSLGVLHTARLFVDQFDRVRGTHLPVEQRAVLLAAALLHDVGHGPFSHAFEQVMGRRHEKFTQSILLDEATEVHRTLRGFDRDLPSHVARFLDEEADSTHRAGDMPAYLTQVVSGQLDADRCDYLLRDSHATGTNYGDFDLAWMLAQLRPDDAGKRFYLTPKGLSAAETYLFARYHMYRTVYFHKTSRAAEMMLMLLFRRLKELMGQNEDLPEVPALLRNAFTGQLSLMSYLDMDDHTITQLLKTCAHSRDGILQELSAGLLNRQLYKGLDLTGLMPDLEISQLVGFSRQATERLTRRGREPAYHFVEDSPSDTPYAPYHPDAAAPSRQIFVETATGRIVEISQLSDAVIQLRKKYTMFRYYVPADFRDELCDLARTFFGGK